MGTWRRKVIFANVLCGNMTSRQILGAKMGFYQRLIFGCFLRSISKDVIETRLVTVVGWLLVGRRTGNMDREVTGL